MKSVHICCQTKRKGKASMLGKYLPFLAGLLILVICLENCTVGLPLSKITKQYVTNKIEGQGKTEGQGQVDMKTGAVTFTGTTTFKATSDFKLAQPNNYTDKETVRDHEWDFIKTMLFFLVVSFILVGFITLFLGIIIRATPYVWLNKIDKRYISVLLMAGFTLSYNWIGNFFGFNYHTWYYDLCWAALSWILTNNFWCAISKSIKYDKIVGSLTKFIGKRLFGKTK